MIPKRIVKIDAFFDMVSSAINMADVNPTNIDEQKKLFLKNKQNPQFTYAKPPEELQALKGMVEEIQLKDGPWEKIFKRKQKEILVKIDVLEKLGTQQFATATKKLHAPPSEKLVEMAYKLITLPVEKPSKRMLRTEAVKILRSAFRKVGLEYKIKSIRLAASAFVASRQKELHLQKNERFRSNFLYRLLIHEIGAHVFRYENGALQPLYIFKNSFADYLETEEGIAAYNEYISGLMSTTILRNYAGRVIAVNYAQTHSFVETYEHLEKYYSSKMAWKLTVRAKRGMGDTSQPGGFTKDCVYLRGFLKVKQYAKHNPYSQLFIGKIGIKDLKELEAVSKELVIPKYQVADLFVDVMGQGQAANKEKIDAALSKL